VRIDLPPATLWLILANVVVYLIQMLTGNLPVIWFALWPLGIDPAAGVSFMPWQLLTYGFLHGGLSHLFFNMFALFMFGPALESLFGTRWFATYFLVCIVTAGLAQIFVEFITSAPLAPTVGASGGVFGVLLAFGMYFPRRTIMLLFPPIPLPAWLFVTLYGALELYLGLTGGQPGVANFAHLGGMVGGFAMIMWRRKHRRRRW